MNRLLLTLCASIALGNACSGGGSGSGGGRIAGGASGPVAGAAGNTDASVVGGQTKASGGTRDSGGTTGSGGSTEIGSGGVGGRQSGGTTAAGGGSGGRGDAGGTSSGVRTSLAGATTLGGSDRTGGSSGGGGAGSGGVGGGGTAGRGGTTGGATAPTSGALIQNDVFWKDTAGNPIYSQGGGVLRVGNTYYWYGVRYGGAATYYANPTKLNSDTSFVAVTIYSSTDLAHWKFEGNALDKASVSAKTAVDSGTWIGRVGAAYNATTKKYVLIGQYLGTPDTTQFFATSDTPNGAFTWDHTQATISNVTNNNCGDQSVFTDDDGKAYIVCSSLSGRSNIYIIPLRPSDFLEAQPATRIFGGAGREGNTMFKSNGRYYVCSSDLHGWNASHAYTISATNIMGPYDAEGVIGNTDADFSHVTQTGLFLTVKGSTQDLVIFGGDRWSDFAGNGIGYNQWMPITFNGSKPIMQSLSEWTIDAAAGTWAVGPGNNFVMNPSFEADRTSTSTPAGWTASGSNAKGGHTGTWSWQLSGSLDQTVTGLPNGTYTLAVWAKGAGGTLYAKGFGGTDKTTPLSAGSSWAQITISGIAISNGTCNLGISSGSGNVDDFTLVKQ